MKKKLFSIFLAVMVLLSVTVTAFAEEAVEEPAPEPPPEECEHDYVVTDRVEPTPTVFGYVQLTCTKCGDRYLETIAYEPLPEEPAPEPPAEEVPEEPLPEEPALEPTPEEPAPEPTPEEPEPTQESEPTEEPPVLDDEVMELREEDPEIIQRMEKINLEGKLLGYDKWMEQMGGKPENWSQSQWDSLQQAYQNAKSVCANPNATAEALSAANGALDSAWQNSPGQSNGTSDIYNQSVDAYVDKLSNPKSDEFKKVANKFGVSDEEIDVTAAATEVAVALANVSKTSPGSPEYSDAVIDFIGKVVNFYGEGARALLNKAFGNVPVVNEQIDPAMDAYIDFTTEGSMTTTRGIVNKSQTSTRAQEWLDRNPGAIDGINDVLVPSSMRRGTVTNNQQ